MHRVPKADVWICSGKDFGKRKISKGLTSCARLLHVSTNKYLQLFLNPSGQPRTRQQVKTTRKHLALSVNLVINKEKRTPSLHFKQFQTDGKEKVRFSRSLSKIKTEQMCGSEKMTWRTVSKPLFIYCSCCVTDDCTHSLFITGVTRSTQSEFQLLLLDLHEAESRKLQQDSWGGCSKSPTPVFSVFMMNREKDSFFWVEQRKGCKWPEDDESSCKLWQEKHFKSCQGRCERRGAARTLQVASLAALHHLGERVAQLRQLKDLGVQQLQDGAQTPPTCLLLQLAALQTLLQVPQLLL